VLIAAIFVLAVCGAIYALVKMIQLVATVCYQLSQRNKRIRPEDLCVRVGGVTHRLVDNPDWRLVVRHRNVLELVDGQRGDVLGSTATSGIRNLTLIVNVVKG